MCWPSGRRSPAVEVLLALTSMQSHYAARFSREMGCTASELRTWLPGASRQADIRWLDDGACIEWSGGKLILQWQPQPPRRIALVTLPRLLVHFEFGATAEDDRNAFMKHFDLYTQRGGG